MLHGLRRIDIEVGRMVQRLTDLGNLCKVQLNLPTLEPFPEAAGGEAYPKTRRWGHC